MIGASVAVSAILIVLTAVDPVSGFATTTVLLPVIIAALSVMSHLWSRRAQAQRALLEKQSEHLRSSVTRARRQEDLVTEVLDAVDFGVIRITPAGDLVVTNEAHARLQGASDYSDEAQVYTADGVTPLGPDRRPLYRARRGEIFENELVWYGRPGRGRRALNVTARRLVDFDGSRAGSIVVSRDVTAEEEALRAREDLVASVSHELRTPLTSIIGYLDLVLDDDALSETSRGELGVVQRNAERLLEIVSDVLSASSSNGVEIDLRYARADVAVLVRDAVQDAMPVAAQRRIRITVGGADPAYAVIDVHRLRQVVDNLLTNAVKYGVDGGRIDVVVAADDVSVSIEVTDDGIGVSCEELPLLFERFFRSDAVRNSSTHGSGLGLAISRDIVRAHGGDITVRSELGVGSTFTVRLPAGDQGAA